MTQAELLSLLQEFYRETLDLVQARQIAARSITDYSANNAYQQVLGRQDVHLRWLSDTIEALGGTNARHRKMLQLILGEMAEHLRIFQQALEGRTDLLGRHSAGKIPRGEVMPSRPRN